jgi:surfeit locus 1 family protein
MSLNNPPYKTSRFFILNPLITATAIALFMVWAAIWQWNRHLEKKRLIEALNTTLSSDVLNLNDLIASRQHIDWSKEIWRRVQLSGCYDFDREVIVRRNRGSNNYAGFHVITPLKLDGSDQSVMIDRGFIPLGRHKPEQRALYRKSERVQLFGIIKQPQELSRLRRLFAPPDLARRVQSIDHIEIWNRVSIDRLQERLPYQILPVYLEVMSDPNEPLLASKIVRSDVAGRNEVLALHGGEQVRNLGLDSPDGDYPIPTFDTTPPPDIHIGYVYEWSFMALLTMGIGIVVMIRRKGATYS